MIDDHKAAAEKLKQSGKPKNWFVGILFIIIWVIIAFWISKIIFHHIIGCFLKDCLEESKN
ncbi:hypothetical protein [Lysinibacillus sp. NPDC093692]|uniref:hypothetical protein n=1 Tax=Lysinibacillus sp. NPDC093692 TaxID=3390578 RepID=UPI003CFDD48B